MAELFCGDVFESGNLVCLFQGFLTVHSHHELFFLALGCGQIVGRNAVAPPQLAADAPVVNVLQPVAVCGDILLGVELDLAFQYRRQGDVGEMLHGEIPLHAEARLYGGIGVTLRVAHLVGIVLHLFHQAGSLQVFGNLLAHFHAVLAHIESGCGRECAVGVEDVDSLQVVGFAQVIVIDIVCGSNLQTAGSELDVHIAVFYYGNDAVYQRNHNLVSLQPLVLGVFGVDAHGGVAHDGLGSGGGHYGIVASLLVLMQYLALASGGNNGIHICICHIVTQVVQVTLLFAVDYLNV